MYGRSSRGSRGRSNCESDPASILARARLPSVLFVRPARRVRAARRHSAGRPSVSRPACLICMFINHLPISIHQRALQRLDQRPNSLASTIPLPPTAHLQCPLQPAFSLGAQTAQPRSHSSTRSIIQTTSAFEAMARRPSWTFAMPFGAKEMPDMK